jgi:hypothetical protein
MLLIGRHKRGMVVLEHTQHCTQHGQLEVPLSGIDTKVAQREHYKPTTLSICLCSLRLYSPATGIKDNSGGEQQT